MKYWFQRFRLFSKFKDGILMDRGINSTKKFLIYNFFFRRLVFSNT